MNDVKLTDFTEEELRFAYVALGMFQNPSEKEKDIIERWQTQIIYAAGLNAVKEKIAQN